MHNLRVKVIPNKRNKSINHANLKYHMKMKLKKAKLIIKLHIGKKKGDFKESYIGCKQTLGPGLDTILMSFLSRMETT